MNVVKISNGMLSDINTKAYTPKEINKNETKTAENTKISAQETAENTANKIKWQKDILISALDKLENNIQLDNSHPLSEQKNIPIETFDEALIELSFINSSFFKADGSNAQANISATSIIELFSDDLELIN